MQIIHKNKLELPFCSVFLVIFKIGWEYRGMALKFGVNEGYK